MLGRRQFRIKVLQGLYAYYQGGEPRIEVAERNLLHSIEKIEELYILQFSFLLEIIDFYHRRGEDAKLKFYPTIEELNPSKKLLDNQVVRQLRENKFLAGKTNQYKIHWTEEQDMVRKVFQRIKDSKDHHEYICSGELSYREDQEFVSKLFKKYILKSPELQSYCEDRNIHWADDFSIAASFVLKTVKLMKPEFPSDQTLISLFLKEEETDPSGDHQFIVDLFRKTILFSDEYEKMIGGRTKNWELDRIAMTDVILLKMALTELIHFSNIPIKVTLNEYIEMSKHFSSVKSKLFINGILDKLVSDLIESDRIHKTGRGLMN